jgi:hypothetical protein
MKQPTKKHPNDAHTGEIRQLAKTIPPQTSRVDGASRRIRVWPEPQKSRNEVTGSSLLARGYHIAPVIIGHGDDAELVFFEKFGGFAGWDKNVMLHGRMRLGMNAVDL